MNERPPKPSGFICAYNPVAAGLNPQRTIYAFLFCIIEILIRKGQKLTKRGQDWPIF